MARALQAQIVDSLVDVVTAGAFPLPDVDLLIGMQRTPKDRRLVLLVMPGGTMAALAGLAFLLESTRSGVAALMLSRDQSPALSALTEGKADEAQTGTVVRAASPTRVSDAVVLLLPDSLLDRYELKAQELRVPVQALMTETLTAEIDRAKRSIRLPSDGTAVNRRSAEPSEQLEKETRP